MQEHAKALAEAQQWDELTQLLAPVQSRSAEMNLYYGIALARLGRFIEAEQTLEQGERISPADPRFPTELAGLAYQQKKNARAEQLLRQALRLAPHDTYANDFLATLFFLDGNFEAALKYWNRLAKPDIAEVHAIPEPRVSPALLDHAFAFSPASTLQLSRLFDTQARISGLGTFPQYRLELDSRDDGRFDLILRARERNGFGESLLERMYLLFRGIPFQQVSPSYYNFHREAINLDSIIRWDAQKRRIFAQLSGPFEHDAKCRWELMTDLRNENWALRNNSAGNAPIRASFNLRTAAGGFDIASHASGLYGWRAGAQISYRIFRSVIPGDMLTAQMLSSGYELKQRAEASAVLVRIPERRFVMHANTTSDAARLWSTTNATFEKLTGTLDWHWFPRHRDEDYEAMQSLRAGKVYGRAPFDELFILGLEHDNDLIMRAHIGTSDGRKGSAPLGSAYFIENADLDKNIFGNGLIALKLGPFVDLGKIVDPGTALGSHKWLCDTGAQIKLRVLGRGLAFSYGKDLRSGNNAFYLRLLN